MKYPLLSQKFPGDNRKKDSIGSGAEKEINS